MKHSLWKYLQVLLILSTFFFFMESAHAKPARKTVPQPSPCVNSFFYTQGGPGYKNVTLRITNHCGFPVDFQNVNVTFNNKTNLDTAFWGDFGPLSRPDSALRITSQKQAENLYLASFSLHFPANGNSVLADNKGIAITYQVPTDDHLGGSANVYLQTSPDVGDILFINMSPKPPNVVQTFAFVYLKQNGQTIGNVRVPWNSSITLSSIAVGVYNITADAIYDTTAKKWEAVIQPNSVVVQAGQTARTMIRYETAATQSAKLNIKLQALPSQLAGYTDKPIVQVTQVDSGSAVPTTLNWNATTTVSSLVNGKSYSFSTPTIAYKEYVCTPTFAPTVLTASNSTTTPLTNLTYTCNGIPKNSIAVNVNGAPTTLNSLNVTFTPNNNTAPVTQAISLANGSGSGTVSLTNATIYNVSSDDVSGYTISFDPQPLTSAPNASETITLTKIDDGTPTSINGQLKVCGTKLCNAHDVPVQLRGMSSHGIQWYGLNKCLTTDSLNVLANDFHADVLRISLYVQEGGYETDPQGFTNQVSSLIEEATRRGIYALVDWHILDPGDPNVNLENAKQFFSTIATLHHDKTNLIYEIANEPNGVSWARIKEYADALIPVIRAIDPNTVILVGTPGWSSLGVSDGRTSQDIIDAPVNFPNIMYTFHFYAGSHHDEYLNELDKASSVLPIFVTEFGTQLSTGDGDNDFTMAERYLTLMNTKMVSWTNWNYSDDSRSGAIWVTGTCPNGPWTDANLKPAGVWVKDHIRNRN